MRPCYGPAARPANEAATPCESRPHRLGQAPMGLNFPQGTADHLERSGIMKERHNGLLAAMRREPEQAVFLLKSGLGGPLVIVVWGWLAAYILPAPAIAPLTLILTLVYGGVLAYLVYGISEAAGRWQVDAAEQASRLIASRRHLGRPVGHYDEPQARETPQAHALDAPQPAPPSQPAPPPPPPAPRPLSPSLEPEPGFQQRYFLMRLEAELQEARREGRQM